MVYRNNMRSDFTKCSKCGGKAYKVGTEDHWSEHCWTCNNEDTTVVVDFSDSGWRPMKRAKD
jgi:hypothetical protein